MPEKASWQRRGASRGGPLLAIVTYQAAGDPPDVIRGVDCNGVVALVVARGHVAGERRYTMRGGALPLVTSALFQCHVGLQSLDDLRPVAVASSQR